MSDSVNSGFLIGFNLVLTCVLVSIAMVLLSNGKVLTASVSTKISAVNANIQDDGLIQYDGATVKGSDIVNCIKRYSSKLDITVNKLCGSKAETATVCKWSTSDLNGKKFNNLPSYAYDDMTGNPLSDRQIYINPNADFKGDVIKNANGVITSIVFNQVSYHQDAYEIPDSGNTTVVINNSNNDVNATLAASLSSLQVATESLNSAIENLQNSGSGTSSVQAQMLAILQTLSGEVLPGMSSKLDDLSYATGTSPDISKDITKMQGDISSIYELLKKADFKTSDHSIDELYNNTTSANSNLASVASDMNAMNAKFELMAQQVHNIQNSINSMASQMSSDHAAILSALNSLQAEQVKQSQKLDEIESKVSGVVGENSRLKSKVKQQADEISYLESLLASRSTGVSTYGDLKEYSKRDASYLNQIRDLQTQYQNLVYIMKTVSGDFSDFNDWVQAHPGKTA